MKPLPLEECRCFGDFLAIAIDELEGTGKGFALTLFDSTRDVSIDEGVCVDIERVSRRGLSTERAVCHARLQEAMSFRVRASVLRMSSAVTRPLPVI